VTGESSPVSILEDSSLMVASFSLMIYYTDNLFIKFFIYNIFTINNIILEITGCVGPSLMSDIINIMMVGII